MTALWLLAALAPLAVVTAMALAGLGRDGGPARDRLARLAPAAVLPAGLLALAGPAAGAVDLPWLLMGTELQVDQLARPLLLVAVLLYGAALLAVPASGTDRAPVLSGFLLVTFTGNAGVLVAADAITFYLAFTVMSLAGYGLVVHEGTRSARRAATVYLVLALAGEMLLLAGLLAVVASGGRSLADAPQAVAHSDATGVIVLLLLAGFGVKAGTVPLHVWLPLAHPAAPPPASAVLSGAMIKAGLVGWLRFLPLGEEALPGWGTAVVVLALAGAFLAVPVGVLQADAKVVLAYSSISQMGMMTVPVGVALAEPELAGAATAAAVLYAVHHGLAKGSLFLGVGVWHAHGAGSARGWVLAGLAAAGLAVAGAPLSSGAVGKYAVKGSVAHSAVLGLDLGHLLPLVGTGSVLLLARFGWLLLRDDQHQEATGRGLLAAWAGLLAAGAALTWVLAGRWVPVESLPSPDPATLWDEAWPVLLGVVLVALGVSLARRELVPRWAAASSRPAVPPGDLLLPEEAALARLVAAEHRLESALAHGRRQAEGQLAARRQGVDRWGGLLAGDGGLAGWRVSGLAALLVLVLLLLGGIW